MNSSTRILLIDKAIDRKERIKALKSHGYAVFPALSMDEARSRCLRGGYDLIVVNSEGADLEPAIQFCDEILRLSPRQQLILCCTGEAGRDYAVSSDTSSVVQAVESTLSGTAGKADLASAA